MPESRVPPAIQISPTSLGVEFFARDTLIVARELIGTTLVVGGCRGRIIETEAYTTDAASHSVTRRHSARLMSETVGHLYVYQIYGMHFCLNFTTEREGVGAVLIRAVEPIVGMSVMSRRRRTADPRRLARGPGCVCQAFGVDRRFQGRPIGAGLSVEHSWQESDASARPIGVSPRIGITKAVELPWRFFEWDNPFVSRGPAGERLA